MRFKVTVKHTPKNASGMLDSNAARVASAKGRTLDKAYLNAVSEIAKGVDNVEHSELVPLFEAARKNIRYRKDTTMSEAESWYRAYSVEIRRL